MPLPIPLAALLLAAPQAADPPKAKPMCQNSEAQRTNTARPPVARARKLGELPPADAVLTVLRNENGCAKPVIVRENIGNTAPR